ncbi:MULTISPECIES: hypothetical protein [Halomonas]|uniref:Uncharacterized protein n=1 Tax=Halomonas halophila TaxID=29573 RepID=A0ABQ0U836_9GAMM|nr:MULTISPECIES: hypothetical protein [Halomonas]MDR5887921.1 hypothetical protein [Halomonas salina]WJY08450.1 hypothetical protein QWG60_05920 [Halomonas halophila]GEK74677.1 hypothetical protein HHA04nite_32210 [Halomonas halophila]
MGSHDLDESRRELLARVLQHGGVLAAPFGHAGENSHESRDLADIAALEEAGHLVIQRDDEGRPSRLELTPSGYRVLGID